MNKACSNGQDQPQRPRPPIKRGNLTRRFLMELEAGLYLVSNIHDGMTRETATPVLAEAVVGLEDRNAQWERVKSVHADGRLCDVFESPEHYVEWKQHLDSEFRA